MNFSERLHHFTGMSEIPLPIGWLHITEDSIKKFGGHKMNKFSISAFLRILVFLSIFIFVLAYANFAYCGSKNLAFRKTVAARGEFFTGGWGNGLVTDFSSLTDGIFFDTHNDPNSHLAEEYAKLISKEGTIFSHWNYFTIRDIKELNTYRCEVDVNNMPKITNSIHNVHWTYFTNGEFKKGSNKINFHGGTKII